MSVRVIEEQEIEESINEEECMKEEISDIMQPEMCSTDGKIHTDELKLETPKINAVEISEMPSELKLEIPIEQSESKLMQDMTLVSDVPIPFHNYVQPATEQEIILPERNIAQSYDRIGVIPTNIKSIGRLPSKLSNKQSGSGGEINKKMSPYMNPIYRPPPKPPIMKNREEKEKKIWDYRPPPKPPYIQNADGEMIGILEKESLLYVGPEYRPPLKPPRIQDNAEERIWAPPKPPNIQNTNKEKKWDYRPPPEPPPKTSNIARVPNIM